MHTFSVRTSNAVPYSSISGTPSAFWANASYWNGVYAGQCSSSGILETQGSYAYYWSNSQYNPVGAYFLYFKTDSNAFPQSYVYKYYGFSVRCVL